MGTYDTRGGSPLSNPMFDQGREPTALEDEALECFERLQVLKAEYDAQREAATLALEKAMRILIRPGDVVARTGDRNTPIWLRGIRTTVGNDRSAQRFEIAGEVSIRLDKSHPVYSQWHASAYPLNDSGKRLSGRTHHGRQDGTVEIKADVCLDPLFSDESESKLMERLMLVIEAAALKQMGEAPTPSDEQPFSELS